MLDRLPVIGEPFCMENIRDGMPLFRVKDPLKPNSAKELEIYKCNVHRACELNMLWHSRFPKIDWSNVVRNKHYICFVAEFDSIAYASAIWSSPIAANRLLGGNEMLELRRMAISDDAPFNTATRMISQMVKNIKKEFKGIKKLISYQDTDVHHGTIYKASNWIAVAENKGTDWSTSKRKRNQVQSMSAKVRWEYEL
jgi:hypothetical protein